MKTISISPRTAFKLISALFVLFFWVYVYLLGGIGALASKHLVLRPLWISEMSETLPPELCKPELDYRRCYLLEEIECLESVSSMSKQCLAQFENEMPFFIVQPDGGRAWGKKVRRCIDERFQLAYAARFQEKIENCSDSEVVLTDPFEVYLRKQPLAKALADIQPDLKRLFQRMFSQLSEEEKKASRPILSDMKSIYAATGDFIPRASDEKLLSMARATLELLRVYQAINSAACYRTLYSVYREDDSALRKKDMETLHTDIGTRARGVFETALADLVNEGVKDRTPMRKLVLSSDALLAFDSVITSELFAIDIEAGEASSRLQQDIGCRAEINVLSKIFEQDDDKAAFFLRTYYTKMQLESEEARR